MTGKWPQRVNVPCKPAHHTHASPLACRDGMSHSAERDRTLQSKHSRGARPNWEFSGRGGLTRSSCVGVH
jgi:hypothetical protein